MKRLQVLINGQWEYVFCRNELKRLPITTKDKLKAIRGNEDSLKYFKNHFGSLEFRII
jgi:hypothetical protein